MGMQEVRLARIEARELAALQASPMFRIQGQPPTHPTPTPVNQPYAVMPHAPYGNARFRQLDNDDQSRHRLDGHHDRYSIGWLECYRLAVQPSPERVSGPRRHL